MRTNTNKLISGALVAGMTLITTVSAATNIGTGTINGTSTGILWDDNFNPGYASGSVGLTIKAKVLPTLNMAVSGSGEIDLGELSSAVYNSGTVDIEVGTNAANGASVTAASTNGGLKNSLSADILNSTVSDGIADSYQFSSVLGTTDSVFTGSINEVPLSATEVNSTSPQTIYSSARPQALDGVNDFSFTVATKPNAQTPAGNYTDTVVLTVTGTF